ncbi:MAG: aminotransferase class I/II-fold pyridoxal phosphate-dependent enzyme, partial [Phycisphaerae bacterium]
MGCSASGLIGNRTPHRTPHRTPRRTRTITPRDSPMPTANFHSRTDALFTKLREDRVWKELQTLEGPMDARVRMKFGHGPAATHRDVLCFCSNNYLGLANHPEVIEAGVKALKDYGAGTASVRFICGTFSPHWDLEREIARLMGTESSYSFVSAWTANEAVFPTLCEPGDIIISDELNHACIIDSIRLATTIKKGLHKAVYTNNKLEGERSLHAALEAAKNNPEVTGQIWVVTDGVFSMEGSIADLPAMRKLCDQYGARLVVDDSHGHGVMGTLGRGTHEHFGMVEALRDAETQRRTDGVQSTAANASPATSTSSLRLSVSPSLPRVDIFTGTLGKALGGGAGGFVAASDQVIQLLI